MIKILMGLMDFFKSYFIYFLGGSMVKRFKLEVNNNIEIYDDDKVYKSRIQ